MWFFSLSYASGPGHSDHTNPSGGRINPRGRTYTDPSFRQPTTVPELDETHAGEDVGVYASGPHAHVRIDSSLENYVVNMNDLFSFSPVSTSKILSITQ